MNETAFETIASAASVLKVDFSAEEFAGFVEDHGLSEDAIEAVRSVFSYLKDKKQPDYCSNAAEDEPATDEGAEDL